MAQPASAANGHEYCPDLPSVDPRSRMLRSIASQLGHPRGVPGRVVGRLLDRGNAGPIRAAADALELSPFATVADIGLGGGASLPLLLDRVGTTGRVHGVDPAHAMVTAAARRFRRHLAAGRLELHDGSLEGLPFRDAAIDGAITVNTIYFVSDLAVALRECARVLRPGGQLIVGLGDPAAMSRMPVTSHGFSLRSVAEVEAVLTDAGLGVVDHRRVGRDDDAHHLLISATTT